MEQTNKWSPKVVMFVQYAIADNVLLGLATNMLSGVSPFAGSYEYTDQSAGGRVLSWTKNPIPISRGPRNWVDAVRNAREIS